MCFRVYHKACALPFSILSFFVGDRVTYVYVLRSCHHFNCMNLSSKYMFCKITFKLFFDLKDCLLMDSTGLVVLDVPSQSSASLLVKALVNICKCLGRVHQLAQCLSLFHPAF